MKNSGQEKRFIQENPDAIGGHTLEAGQMGQKPDGKKRVIPETEPRTVPVDVTTLRVGYSGIVESAEIGARAQSVRGIVEQEIQVAEQYLLCQCLMWKLSF